MIFHYLFGDKDKKIKQNDDGTITIPAQTEYPEYYPLKDIALDIEATGGARLWHYDSDNEILWGSTTPTLIKKSIDKGDNWTVVYDFDGYEIIAMYVTSADTLLCVMSDTENNSKIMRSTDNGESWTEVYDFGYRTGALSNCFAEHPDYGIFFGEYPTDGNTDTIKVLKSTDDGENWDTSISWNYYFEDEGDNTGDHIRHIHGVFYDEFDNAIWITTGDEDSQCRIYKSENVETWNNDWEIIGEEDQTWRFVNIMFDKAYVFAPTDSASASGVIYRIKRLDNSRESLDENMGSLSWYSVRNPNGYMFAVSTPHVNHSKDNFVNFYHVKYNQVIEILKLPIDGDTHGNVRNLYATNDYIYCNLKDCGPVAGTTFVRFKIEKIRYKNP